MSTQAPPLADPRPVIVDGMLEGGRCVTCSHALLFARPRCPRCGGEVVPERFGPEGSVWAVTVVHVPSRPDEEVPYTLAYVDLDDGPRVLARLDAACPVGGRVRLTGPGPAAEVLA